MALTTESVQNQFKISEQLFQDEFLPRFNVDHGGNNAIKTFESLAGQFLVSVSESGQCDYVDPYNIPAITKYLIGFLKFRWLNVEGKTKYYNRSFYFCFIADESGILNGINFGNVFLKEIIFERYSIGKSAFPKPKFKTKLSNGTCVEERCTFSEYFQYINDINLAEHGSINTQKEYDFYKLYLIERDRKP